MKLLHFVYVESGLMTLIKIKKDSATIVIDMAKCRDCGKSLGMGRNLHLIIHVIEVLNRKKDKARFSYYIEDRNGKEK